MKPAPGIHAKDIKAGDTFELDLYVQVAMYGGISVSLHRWDDYVLLGTVPVVFTVPEGFNPVHQAVSVIDKRLDDLSDKYQKERAVLNEKKAELLQISYGGAEVLDAVKDPK